MKKRSQDISKVILKSILLTGVFVAVLAMSTTSVQIAQYLCDQQEVEQTQEDRNEAEEQETLKSFEAITTSAQITLDHEFLLIDILPELISEGESSSSSEDQTSFGGKVQRILFRQIISPNAP